MRPQKVCDSGEVWEQAQPSPPRATPSLSVNALCPLRRVVVGVVGGRLRVRIAVPTSENRVESSHQPGIGDKGWSDWSVMSWSTQKVRTEFAVRKVTGGDE
jgi:hypothetical protein